MLKISISPREFKLFQQLYLTRTAANMLQLMLKPQFYQVKPQILQHTKESSTTCTAQEPSDITNDSYPESSILDDFSTQNALCLQRLEPFILQRCFQLQPTLLECNSCLEYKGFQVRCSSKLAFKNRGLQVGIPLKTNDSRQESNLRQRILGKNSFETR